MRVLLGGLRPVTMPFPTPRLSFYEHFHLCMCLLFSSLTNKQHWGVGVCVNKYKTHNTPPLSVTSLTVGKNPHPGLIWRNSISYQTLIACNVEASSCFSLPTASSTPAPQNKAEKHSERNGRSRDTKSHAGSNRNKQFVPL